MLEPSGMKSLDREIVEDAGVDEKSPGFVPLRRATGTGRCSCGERKCHRQYHFSCAIMHRAKLN